MRKGICNNTIRHRLYSLSFHPGGRALKVWKAVFDVMSKYEWVAVWLEAGALIAIFFLDLSEYKKQGRDREEQARIQPAKKGNYLVGLQVGQFSSRPMCSWRPCDVVTQGCSVQGGLWRTCC